MRSIGKSLFVTAFCVLMLSYSSLGSAYATPEKQGDVSGGVGIYSEQAEPCKSTSALFKMISGLVGLVLGGDVGAGAASIAAEGVDHYIGLGCSQAVAEIYAQVEIMFHDAYLEAEVGKASPGYPDGGIEGIHDWVDFPMQDFSGGTDSSGNLNGDGWGAIIWGGADANEPPHYVGGGHWVAYKAAVYDLDIVPGYPLNAPYRMNNATIQDFRGGTWEGSAMGDAAIIGDETAFLVAGRHWEAYQGVNGSARLGNPTGPWHQNSDGWYEQDFEGGEIAELNHDITVIYYDGSPTDYLYIE